MCLRYLLLALSIAAVRAQWDDPYAEKAFVGTDGYAPDPFFSDAPPPPNAIVDTTGTFRYDDNIEPKDIEVQELLYWLRFDDQPELPGPCPFIEPENLVEWGNFLGEWTVNADNNVTNLNYNTKVTANFQIGTYGELWLTLKKERCEREIDYFHVPFFWTPNPSIQKFRDFQHAWARTITRTVIKTDSKQYSVEHFCVTTGQNTHKEMWWLLTRKRCELSLVEMALFTELLEKYGINIEPYSSYKQDENISEPDQLTDDNRAREIWNMFKKYPMQGSPVPMYPIYSQPYGMVPRARSILN